MFLVEPNANADQNKLSNGDSVYPSRYLKQFSKNCAQQCLLPSKPKKSLKFSEKSSCLYFDQRNPVEELKSPLKLIEFVAVNFDGRNEIGKLCRLISGNVDGNKVFIGQVVAENLAFQKHIAVRYSCDEWKTYREIIAGFVESIDNRHDCFAFQIPMSDEEHSLEFAIRYEYANNVYWDNNEGRNYRFVVITTYENNEELVRTL